MLSPFVNDQCSLRRSAPSTLLPRWQVLLRVVLLPNMFPGDGVFISIYQLEPSPSLLLRSSSPCRNRDYYPSLSKRSSANLIWRDYSFSFRTPPSPLLFVRESDG